MLINEVIKIGAGDYHPESFFAPKVAEFINSEGIAFWDDIFDYIEQSVDLTQADKDPVSNNSVPRWKKNITNLHAHRTLEGGKFGDIVRVAGGFATADAANELGVEILPDNSIRRSNPGNLSPQQVKKKVGIITNAAYTEMGKPKLDNSSETRKEIEQMVKSDPMVSDETFITRAMEIITNHIK